MTRKFADFGDVGEVKKYRRLSGAVEVEPYIWEIQLTVSEEQRGRVMGKMYFLSQLGGGVGTHLIGTFAVTRGLVTPMLVAVLLCVVVWLVFLVRQRELVCCFHGVAGK